MIGRREERKRGKKGSGEQRNGTPGERKSREEEARERGREDSGRRASKEERKSAEERVFGTEKAKKR